MNTYRGTRWRLQRHILDENEQDPPQNCRIESQRWQIGRNAHSDLPVLQRLWTTVWSAYFRPLLAKAMVGEASVDEVMKAGAEKWNELREKMAKK